MHPALRTPAYIRTPCYKGQLFFSQALTFKPLNTDTPTLFMAHSGSVLRLLTGFYCEGKTWLRDTSYVCRKHDFTSLKCLCKIFRGKQYVLSKLG